MNSEYQSTLAASAQKTFLIIFLNFSKDINLLCKIIQILYLD
jgi:hypothetical protein